MIERASEFGANATPVPIVTGDTASKTAGDMLREAREAHGLHIDMVAAALKVSTRKLAALEDNDIDALPDQVFARALAASVARALRIDPGPVLAKLPGAQESRLAEADLTISKSLRSAAPRGGVGANRMPSRALLVVVLLLLAGAAMLFWLPQSAFDQVSASFARVTGRGDADAPVASTEPTPPASVQSGVVADAVPSAAVTTPPKAPAVPADSPAPAASSAASPGGNQVAFVVREDSWVSVSEAGGKSLLRRTVRSGETVGVTGVPPLSVVVGRAAGVDVQVRGKPFDLTPLARSGGVARFEIKP